MRFSKSGGVRTPEELKQVSWTNETGCLLSTTHPVNIANGMGKE